MNILYISSHEEWGRAFNGKTLHEKLLQEGYHSEMAVLQPQLNSTGVVKIGRKVVRGINRGLVALEKTLSLHSVFPVLGIELLNSPAYKRADILHFQLFHSESFISLFSLPRLCEGKKVVVTIHDMWPFTGHCINSLGCNKWMTGCGNCPDFSIPFPIHRDTTNWMWKIKRDVFTSTEMFLVVGSEWMKERVKESPILSKKPIYHIPFGVDTDVFFPRDKASWREKMGIPNDAFVIAFRSKLGKGDIKGTQYLVDALMQSDLGDNVYLVTFDRAGLVAELKTKYHMIELGWIENAVEMAECLSAADVYVIPSLADSFGMTAVEALACGTPVITFEGTAIPEVIDAPMGGVAVPARDSSALAHSLALFHQDQNMRKALRAYGLSLVKQKYSFERYYQKHLALYQSLA